jgi:hypothetical protein
VGRKRAQEEIHMDPFSKYGSAEGRSICEKESHVRCGFIVSSWPAWVVGAGQRGCIIRLIIKKDSLWTNFLSGLFPTTRILVYNSDIMSYSKELARVACWVCDIEPPRKLDLWNSTASLIIIMRKARVFHKMSWQPYAKFITHADVGGITDGQWRINFYHPTGAPLIDEYLNFQASVSRDLSCILNTTSHGRPCPNPPKVAYVQQKTPQVHEVRPNTFHPHGLVPWGTRHYWVISPSIYSPTGWVRRRLSVQEQLATLDIPKEV